jgi:thiol-disulfide isomerase/thioredoxin
MKPAVIGVLVLSAILLILLTVFGVGHLKQGFANPVGITNDRGTFTMYYADWCPHCQTVKPIFKELMGSSGVLTVKGQPITLEMIEEKEIDKSKAPPIKGYPTFLYSDSARKTIEFDGPRNADGFMKFLEQQILS